MKCRNCKEEVFYDSSRRGWFHRENRLIDCITRDTVAIPNINNRKVGK